MGKEQYLACLGLALNNIRGRISNLPPENFISDQIIEYARQQEVYPYPGGAVINTAIAYLQHEQRLGRKSDSITLFACVGDDRYGVNYLEAVRSMKLNDLQI